jgi:hypothetical protein
MSTAIMVDVETLRQVIREELAAASRPQPRRSALPSMLTAAEADRTFRKAKGTAAAAYRAGLVRGEERPGQSSTGFVIYIRRADAERTWGGKQASDLARSV